MTKEKFCRESRVIQTHRVFPFDLNPFGALFGGKLMSLIDDAASISVSRHCRRGAVTASLDNLNFLKPLKKITQCVLKRLFLACIINRWKYLLKL